MSQPPIPPDEVKRLAALLALQILDTPPEERFGRITRQATRLFSVPIALVSLIDTDREWFKACEGLPFTATAREYSFSAHAILGSDVLVIPDTLNDTRFADNPLVTGEPFIRFYAGQPISTSDGSKVGTLCILDRHPRQLSEADLNVLRDLSAWAESELVVTEFRQALITKTDLLSTLGHEIRTPLNSVIGMVGLLLETNLHGEQLEMVEAIRTSGETLTSIVNGILDFSRLDSGSVPLEIENFEPKALVETTVRLILPRVRPKGIPVRVTVDPEIPAILTGDPGMLRQILLNLIDNAVKFTEKGDIHVEVTLQSSTVEHSTLRFAVHDTGVGLSESAGQNLFQTSGNPPHRFGGMGLGLAICRRLVEMLGGQIGVESQEGVGSSFWFAVQCGTPSATITSTSVRTEDNQLQQAATIAQVPPDPTPRVRNDPKPRPTTTYRVLLAEDNVVNQKITLRQLEKLGYGAESVLNGEEAIDAVNRDTFDLVLMDCQMPVMDGFEATMQIREAEVHSGKKHLPIIAMTANVLEGDRDACISAGMDDYIGKPVSLDQLREVLDRWLPITRPMVHEPVAPTKASSAPIPAPPEHRTTTLDAEALDNLRKLVQPPFFSALIDDFFKNSDELLKTLRAAIERNDQEVTLRTAHTLKSSSANYGARVFSTLCKELEQMARVGQLEGAAERIVQIETEYQNVKAALEQERNRGV